MADNKKSKINTFLRIVCQLFTIIILVAVDQVVKKAAVANLQGKEPKVLIKNIIGLTYAENTGAAFSFMSNSTTLLSVITLVLLLAGAAALFTGKIRGKLLSVCAVLIISGGTGNLIDRFAQGYVVDYIETLFIDFPVYNLADIFVTCGVFVVCIYLIYDMIREEKQKKAASSASYGDSADGNS